MAIRMGMLGLGRCARELARRRFSSTALTSAEVLALEHKFGAFNYAPLPVVLQKGEGVYLYSIEGKRYLDFLSAFSAVNQGHCHPRLVSALTKQASRLTLTSRAFHNNLLGQYERAVCERFSYDRMLPMNTGVEACESAVKLARHWAYEVKKVEPLQAKVVLANGNFWGRSIAAISSSSDPTCYENFGPFTPGFELINYDDLEALERSVSDPNTAAFMVEPIQGEAGVVVPQAGYLREAKRICDKHHCLLIADEVQTGLGRTGKMLCIDHDAVKPDMVVLGKALSGGILPASAVLASDEVMLTLQPGQHGSTYGGNPLSCAVALEALQVLEDEKLPENAERLGKMFREGIESIKSEHIQFVRGKGLLNAVSIKPKGEKKAYDVCLALMEKGILAKQTHDHIVRFAPPLVINDEQITQCLQTLDEVLREF